MKAIYFGKPNSGLGQKLGKDLLHWSTDKLSTNFPFLSDQLSEYVLCRPHKSKTNRMSKSFHVDEIDVHGNRIKLYSRGESQKALLFIHGWSGDATNFKKFYPLALSRGYSVWAIDHVAHGKSSGKFANMFLFVEAIKKSLQFIRARQDIVGIVAHSMGASAVISAEVSKDIPLVMLAPVLPFFDNMYEVIGKVGISPKVLDSLITKIESRMGLKREEIDPEKKWSQLKNNYLIFHDMQDQYIPIEKNLKVIGKNTNYTLNVTDGLGHFRILRDIDIVQQALDFFEEDTQSDQ